MLIAIFQRYNLKAIYNISMNGQDIMELIAIFQRYNLKAIYNTNVLIPGPSPVDSNIPKIQSESYLQL